jgi:phthiocerol/phenolphthiocerol synthesis type-I polyketide synthase C
MAARLPGAPDLAAFWRLLEEGREAIGPVPDLRWDTAAQLDPEKDIQAVGGFLDGVELFDPTFFGISPREAADVDPQHRLFLESSWRALEDAGVPADRLAGTRTGVYVGASWHDYEILRKDRGAGATQHTAIGNALDMIATRVSYFLKLDGPSLTLETGCSSALVALHTATLALRSGDIEAAIVGGVNLILAPDVSIGLTHFGGLSPTGRCHAFSADADGFVRGEGVVALYIKTLSKALADGDDIRAVIVGTAVNNDGGGESLVTPNPEGQRRLLESVYGERGLDPARVDYIEAHGTGTRRGDPIETTAIGRVVGLQRPDNRGPVAIGSVKTNIGHLEACAGLAGLAKVVLSLEHRVVPASLHAEQLNPEIDFDGLNLSVTREPLAFPGKRPLHMGVNSFGWGGTNAHAVLRSAPEPAADAPEAAEASPAHGIPALVTVSAHKDEALRTRVSDVRELIGCQEPAQVAGALAYRRDHFPVRAAAVAESAEQVRDLLRRYLADPDEAPEVLTGRARPVEKVAFVFPGQGSQSLGMGRKLLAESPLFAAVVDRCNAALRPHVDWDLVEVLSGRHGEGWIERIDMVQPALWAVTLGLTELWRAAGVEPDVVVGHSQGEITAATAAGLLSYDDAALIMARRSAIAKRTSGSGRMLVVGLDYESAHASLAGFEETVSVAAHNGPTSCLLSGETDSVLLLKELLEADEVFCRLVNVDYASHSPQMDQLRPDLLTALAEIKPRPGGVAMFSTVLQRRVEAHELDAGYWADNLRRPVMFADVMDQLFDEGVTHVVEMSPHPVISPAVEQLAAQRPQPPVALSSVRREQDGPADFAAALGRAYVAGLSPFGLLERGSRTELPGYPWQRSEYWVAAGRRRSAGTELGVELAPSSVQADTWTGDLELGTDQSPWLTDHQVHGAVVVPGTAMLALSLATARARTGIGPRSVRDFEFRSDLTLGDQPAALQVQLHDDITGGGSFKLMSLPAGATGWTEHAVGKLYFDNAGAAAEADAGTGTAWPDFPAHLLVAESTSPEDFYGGWRQRGLEYGPAFQTIERLHADEAGALGELQLNSRCRAAEDALHPSLWDGALQVGLKLFGGDGAVVPVRVARIEFHTPQFEPVQRVWSHAVRRGPLEMDVHVFDSAQQPLMSLHGLALQPIDLGGDAAAENRIVRFAFEPAQPAEAGRLGRWLVLGDDAEAVDEVAKALKAQGVESVASARDTGADLEKLLADRTDVAWLMPDFEAGLPAQRAALSRLAGLVRAGTAKSTPPQLAVITAAAQPAGETSLLDPGAALAWGFTRVARREHGELQLRLIDVAAGWSGWAAGAAAELVAADGEDQVVLNAGQRFVGRLVQGLDEDAQQPAAWQGPAQPFRLFPSRPGFWEGLQLRPLQRRAPAQGEIEVEVTATGLNFIDVMKAMGTYPDPSGGAKIGGECAGRVVAVGPGVTGFEPGDRVVACVFGAAASHVTVPVGQVALIPGQLSDVQAAGLPLVLSTAWHGLVDLAGLEQGETVLVHSAAGGLGLAAIAVAKHRGAKVIATAGSPDKREYLRSLGIQHVFDSRDLSWSERVLEATGGRGVDVVLNSLTGAAIARGLGVLAEDGRFIEVGKLDIYKDRAIGLGAFRKSLTLASVDLAGLMERRPARFAALLAAAWEQVRLGAIAPLPTAEYPIAEAAEALRAMSRGSHIGKFVLCGMDEVGGVVPEPLPEGRFRSDAVYLITGGLGALGLSLAEYMAGLGAKHLALAGRSKPTAAAQAVIKRLRKDGVEVTTHQADVSDPASAGALLAEVRSGGAELRGVVHAAGLLDDATVLTVTPEQIERVLAPKLTAAANLDAATDEDPLDFFVTFSSAAALVGNAGQAAYSAGNAGLDALVAARRRRGRPGLSVQWGPFAEIGLAADDENRGARLSDRGMASFTVEDAWPALADLMSGGAEVAGYLKLDLRQWFEASPETAAQKSWSTLHAASRSGESGSGGGGSNEFLDSLRGSSEQERLGLVQAAVCQLVGRVLRLDPKTVDDDTPFKALGLDSLMGLELRNRLESTFALKLSPTLLWTYGTARALSSQLCQRITDEPAAVAG